jgi:hypothetical protein
MPEPYFSVIRGTDADFTDDLPSAAALLCLVEVADSSLERDMLSLRVGDSEHFSVALKDVLPALFFILAA